MNQSMDSVVREERDGGPPDTNRARHDAAGRITDEAPGRPPEGRTDGDSPDGGPAPAAEPVRDRRRAREAERQLHELRAQLQEARAELDQARERIDEAERRRRIDQLLIEGEAIDLEAARLLTEAAVAQMDEADVEQAVEDLRRRKPFLFRRRGPVSGGGGGGMAARPRAMNEPLDDAAASAATTGDRRDLLRYLRLRRAAAQ